MRPTSLALVLLALGCAPASPPEPGAPAPADDAAGAAPSGAAGPPAAGVPPDEGGAPSLAFERLDLDAECDGLVPEAAPAPVLVRLEGAACVAAPPDGTGAVAAGVRDAVGAIAWRVHRADGAAAGTFTADAPLLPQAQGWHGLQVSRAAPGADPEVDHVAVTAAGEVAARARVSPDPAIRTGARWSLSPDAAGGSAVAVRWTNLGGNHWSGVTVHRFDAAGAPRWPGGAPAGTWDSPREPAFLAPGPAGTGDLLVLAQHSAFVDVTWLDASGSPAGGSVAREPAADVVGERLARALEAAPLLDGSVAVRADGRWTRRYAPRAETGGPLPEWLAARPEHAVRVLGGGRGYALLPPAGREAAGCAAQVDLVSRGGRLCGRVTIRPEGGACTTPELEAGPDGTLVVRAGAEACAVRWWPGLLGRGQ